MLDRCRQCTVTRWARASSRPCSESSGPITDATRGHDRDRWVAFYSTRQHSDSSDTGPMNSEQAQIGLDLL